MGEVRDTIETKLGDLVADGKIAEEDAHILRTYAQFLRELAAEPADRKTPRTMRPAFRARWLAYLLGEADGPAS